MISCLLNLISAQILFLARMREVQQTEAYCTDEKGVFLGRFPSLMWLPQLITQPPNWQTVIV